MKLNKRNLKSNRAITLISLVITIIVLLILAGVTIAILTGDNGLLTKAGEAKNKNAEAEICEQIKLAYAECQVAQYNGTDKTPEKIIEDSLKLTYGDENITGVKVKNGKVIVNMLVNTQPTIYIYKANTGEAYEYIDPFDYGEKEKKDLVPGDDISIGTEKFRVFYNQDGVIKAIPFYNLVTISENGKIIQGPAISEISTEIMSSFSTGVYWTQGDDQINMGDTRNNIQQYINGYNITLQELGASEIEIRIAKYSELNVSGITNTIRNPGRTGTFWLGSSDQNFSDRVWRVESSGSFYNGWYSKLNQSNGIRPIIINEY